MRKVLIVDRNDLCDDAKLKQLIDISMINFIEGIRRQIEQSDIVVFYCSLLNEYRVLKNRYPNTDNSVHQINSPEDENKILTLLMGL